MNRTWCVLHGASCALRDAWCVKRENGLLNPEGIPPQSPGLRACELPWVSWSSTGQPQRGCGSNFLGRSVRATFAKATLVLRLMWPQPQSGLAPLPDFPLQGSSQARNPGLCDKTPLGLQGPDAELSRSRLISCPAFETRTDRRTATIRAFRCYCTMSRKKRCAGEA